MNIVESNEENEEEDIFETQELVDPEAIEDSEAIDRLMNDLGTEQEAENEPFTKQTGMKNLSKEISDYEKMPRILKTRPKSLKWWSEMKEKFPVLSKIAMIILTVPVTEVSVERMFSHLKIVLSNRRTRMDSELLESILLLRMNKKFSNLN